MGRHRLGRIALMLAAGALILGVAPPGRAQPGVGVQLFQFRPGELQVRSGTRLIWTDHDDIAHTVTSGAPGAPDGRFDLSLPGKGTTGAVTIAEPGVYPYFCRRHQSMRGEIRAQ